MKFNKEIDKNSLKVSSKVNNGNILDSVQVLDDNKTVVGVYSAGIGQSTKVDFVISAKSKDGKEEVKEYQKSIVVMDKVAPEFKGAIALNAKQIELQFSEPVNITPSNAYTFLNDIKLDGQSAVAQVGINNAKNTVVLTFANALKEGKHTIEAVDLPDYAGFKSDKASYDVTVTKDEVAPNALKAEVVSKDKIRVTFDESVATKGEFKVNGQDVVTTNTSIVNNTDGKVIEISGLNLDLGAIVEVKVEYKGQKDVLGNEVKEWTKILTQAENDSIAPTVSFKHEEGNKVVLTFSKPMLVNTGKIKILDKDGKAYKEVSVTNFKVDSDNKVLELSAAQLGLDNVDSAKYTLVVDEMKDSTIRGNELDETKFEFTAKDTKKPEVINNYLVTAGKNADDSINTDKDTITIYFSEAMEKASVENLANYFLAPATGQQGKPLSSDINAVSAKMSVDGKSVVINYKGASSFANQVLKVASVKDVAGNFVANGVSSEISKIDDNSKKLDLAGTDNEVIDQNTVKVKFNTKIASVDPTVFTVFKGNDAITGFSSAEVDKTDITGQTVKFTTPVKLDTDASKYTLKVNKAEGVKNIYGSTLTLANPTIALKDKVAPQIVKIEAPEKTNNEIKLTFSEKVKDAKENVANSIVLKDEKGNLLSAVKDNDITEDTSAGTDTITVKLNENVRKELKEGENTITFSMPAPRTIEDMELNKLAAIGDKVIKVTVNNVIEEKKVTSITVKSTGDEVKVTNGSTLQMSVNVLPADADNKDVTWAVVKGTGDATIDENGLLTAKSQGTVTVTAVAKDGSGIKGEKEITVE